MPVTVLKWMLLGVVLHACGCTDTSRDDQASRQQPDNELPEQAKQDAGQVQQSAVSKLNRTRQVQLDARIIHGRFIADSGMLFLEAQFYNSSPDPVYIVANQFAYVDLGPGISPHEIVPVVEGNDLILDLSHTMRTRDAIDYYISEEGSFGRHDECLEIGPGGIRSVVYAFQFPMKVNRMVSPIETFSWPDDVTSVRLRFGCSTEPQDAFADREIESAEGVEDWQRRLVEEWQVIRESESFELEGAK